MTDEASPPGSTASLDAVPSIVDDVTAAEQRLVMTDFDGTLAEIVPRPDDASIRPDARAALDALSSAPHTAVAVVSGRAKDDVEDRVDLPGLWYAGNHGLEIGVDGESFVHPDARETKRTIGRARDELRNRLEDVEGAFVEPKGLTATVHYRLVDGEKRIEIVHDHVREVVDEYASTIDVHDGKEVLELRPTSAWNKGRAVEWMRETAYDDSVDVHPLYVGDDVSDEAAFRAVDDVGTAVRVGDDASATAADVTVADPAAVAAFLSRLADTLA